MTRKPFAKEKITTATKVLDVIHSDLCGPFQTETPSGKRYILTFIDEYSRYTHIYLLREKSEVNQKMKEFIKLMKTQRDAIPKIFNTDRGGEYVNKKVTKLFEKFGIKLQNTAPYTPQLNGIAERKNRYLVEMTRCMLKDANLPNKFWGEAIITANYLQNRLLTRSTNCIPFKTWNNQTPNLEHLNIFGFHCFVKIPNEKRQKLDDSSTKMILLGYDSNNIYKCYNQETNRIVYSRDVKFINNEDIQISLRSTNQSDEILPLIDPLFIDLPSTDSESELSSEFDQTDSQASYDQSKTTDPSPVTTSSESAEPLPRRSSRTNKGIPPIRYGREYNSFLSINSIIAPSTYNQAINSEQKEEWLEAMRDEMKSLQHNSTWTLSKFPEGRKAVGSK